MKNLHVFCLAYNTPKMVREAIALFESQKGEYPISSKTIFDPSYPLSDAASQAEAIEKIAKEFGWEYAQIPNRGVSTNWNVAIQYLGLEAGDVLLGVDPDERPNLVGYMDAMMDVFNHALECYTVQLTQPGIADLVKHEQRQIGKTWIMDCWELCAWPMGAFDIGWLERIGGLKQRHGSYGFIEHATNDAARALGARWYMLRDYMDFHQTSDPEVTKWKLECAQFKTHDDFETWLKRRQA